MIYDWKIRLQDRFPFCVSGVFDLSYYIYYMIYDLEDMFLPDRFVSGVVDVVKIDI